MKHLGHIELTDKGVIFVYHELLKPRPDDYFEPQLQQISGRFWKKLEEYEVSRREVKVSNVSNFSKTNIVKNPKCEAEITDNKATIVKIL